MKPPLLAAALAIGLAIGAWHLWFAAQAIFVFRNGEPISSWLTIVLGPGSTLIATIVAFWNDRVGGIWLICGGLISLVVFAATGAGNYEDIIPFVSQISAPMALLGASILFLSKYSTSTTELPKA